MEIELIPTKNSCMRSLFKLKNTLRLTRIKKLIMVGIEKVIKRESLT